MSGDFPLAELGVLVLGGIGTVVWWLLKDKDAKQSKEMDVMKAEYKQITANLEVKIDRENKILWDKHDEDAAALRKLERQLDTEHYPKREIDPKFAELNNTMKSGFAELGSQVAVLSQTLLTHFIKEDK